MQGRFITFEGAEATGKSTQISLLAERLRSMGQPVRALREPGGTPIGEDIRHTLKHSATNHAMTAETELLLMCASRAQLVREIIRPALASGEFVLCDRYYDSTVAYQGFGRELDMQTVRNTIDFAVGTTRPDLTVLLSLPEDLSAKRRLARQATMPFVRDRIEEADAAFFRRVNQGYQRIAAAEPERVKVLDSSGSVAQVQAQIWSLIQPLLADSTPGGKPVGPNG